MPGEKRPIVVYSAPWMQTPVAPVQLFMLKAPSGLPTNSVRAKDENQRPAIRDALTRIPGIHHILEVEDVPYTSLHDIFEQTLPLWREALEGKTFCVRVKRRGKHEFTSIEVERYVGGGLNQHIETARVKLTDPDVTVNLEIENDRLLLVKGRYEGIGGFPIGTQEDVLSLISGGFDSGVSSYMPD